MPLLCRSRSCICDIASPIGISRIVVPASAGDHGVPLGTSDGFALIFRQCASSIAGIFCCPSVDSRAP